MELKLKDSNEENKPQTKYRVQESTDEETKVTDSQDGMYYNNPVKITNTVVTPTVSNKKSGFDAMDIVKWVVILALVVVAVSLVKGLISPKATDVTKFVNYDYDQLQDAIDEDIEKDTDMSSKITHYSNGTVTVDSAEGIGIVYIDGAQKGLHIDDKKYCMFGISLGDGETTIEDNITYDYTEYMLVLNDLAGGKSTATIYYNTSKNDCLVVFVNDKSARVVAMTYFNDYKLFSTNLDTIE